MLSNKNIQYSIKNTSVFHRLHLVFKYVNFKHRMNKNIFFILKFKNFVYEVMN